MVDNVDVSLPCSHMTSTAPDVESGRYLGTALYARSLLFERRKS
jgi:hypothetical protein